jgi:predicted ATP-dependent protease
MIEAASLARTRDAAVVGAGHLAEALAARDFRVNLFEEEYLEEYDREMIKVATTGQAVGRANGLSVRMFGDHAFGLPHQIACTVGVGHGGILDLEREAELGGPIHTKGMMILKSCLLDRFAKDKPLVMAGSLCFEQSYAAVEGDSASGAELAALLSALADVPIRLCYAMTGAVSQSGAILAVGGLNEKIKGFFTVCRRRGLTGDQGVILPADNVVNLMLDAEVVEAVRQGRFHIFPVTTIEEAMEILTGLPAGRRGPDGRFPDGTLYALVDARLAELARLGAPWMPGPRSAQG